jgi:hypothetical protein
MEILIFEDRTDTLPRNVGKKVPIDAAKHSGSSKAQLHLGEILESCIADSCSAFERFLCCLEPNSYLFKAQCNIILSFTRRLSFLHAFLVKIYALLL